MKEDADGEQAREVERLNRIEANATSPAPGSTEQPSTAVPSGAGDYPDVPAPLPSSVSVPTSSIRIHIAVF